MIPFVLDESESNQLPASLKSLLKWLFETYHHYDSKDIFVILLYHLMLESGFVPADSVLDQAFLGYGYHHNRTLLFSKSLPLNWKHSSHYHFTMTLNDVPSRRCELTVVPACEEMVVNCRVLSQSFSLLLDAGKYVIAGDSTTLPVFQDLRGLSMSFKNRISYPATVGIYQEEKAVMAHLETLPEEIKGKIRQMNKKSKKKL